MDISSVGGWVATRSMGQFSTAYGGIEDMILGLEAVLPSGDVFETRLTPRSAAGPDLKQLFLGGEGTLGVVTAVTFSVRWKPEERIFRAYYAADMEQGFEAQRYIIQTGWRPPVMRQYDPAEAARLFPEHARGEDCLILLIHEGPAALAQAEAAACAGLAIDAGCEPGPEAAAAQWLAERNQVPAVEEYLNQGVVVDTIEIAATWDRIGPIYRGVCASLGEVEGLLLASAHSSHCYRSGLNLYFTFAALPPDSRDMASAYWECWRRTMEAVLAGGGGIAHHHGVGRVRRKWLARELGPGGMKMLGNLKQALDPTGFMNPGVLVGDD
jgi:alkyldihydroxyacetonephosphate synthase